MQADTPAAGQQALTGLAASAGWTATDLVIANSFTTFWAVHAAKAAGRPTLLYVHESTTPAVFYGQRVPRQVVALAEEAFSLADAVSFTTASTRRYHLGYGRPERHRLTPGWVDVAALDQWLARQDRETLRRELGMQPGERLVCNIGTVSDRKGQHTFARAVDLLARRYPALAARTRFILLGGRDSPFDTMLGDSLTEIGRTTSSSIPRPPTTCATTWRRTFSPAPATRSPRPALCWRRWPVARPPWLPPCKVCLSWCAPTWKPCCYPQAIPRRGATALPAC